MVAFIKRFVFCFLPGIITGMQPVSSSKPFFRQRLIVFFFPLLLAAPFLNRATFVDDSYFIEIASWLKDHPALPYHFTADDARIGARGWEEDGFVRMVNPLIHHYYVGFLIKVGGQNEWFLRLGCVLLVGLGGLFLFELARRWTYHPLLATLLAQATPVHWLTSYSLLIDGTLVFFFFGALYFFIRGIELDSVPYFIGSGVLMGLSILTKYPALFIIPLTLVWTFLRWPKISRKWLPFIAWVFGFGFLIAYSLWTRDLYGQAHILAASARMVEAHGWAKILVFLVFLSGSTLLPLLSWFSCRRRTQILSFLLFVALAAFFQSPVGGFSVIQAALLSLWFITTLLFIGVLIGRRNGWENPKDSFLFLWLIGFIGMMYLVMGWVAGRYYVIALPAIVFLSVRLVEMNWPSRAEAILKPSLGVLFIFSLLLAYADYRQAEPSRRLPALLQEKGFKGGERRFYLGDSFTMSYLRSHGWVPCFPETDLRAGDWVLAKEVTMPQIWFYRRGLALRQIAEFNFPSRFPFKVMDNRGSAGWYASVWGALPFTISTGPWERFRLFEILNPSETFSG